MAINLKLLAVFVLVADHRSFRRAAEELGRSQSAVSTQIRQLEEQLGVTLFHRTTRSVSLSPEGQELVGFAHEALNQIQSGIDAIVNAAERQRKSVVVACSPTIASTRLAPILTAFKAELPHVLVHLRELSTADMLECIEAQEVDFGIGPRVKRETDFHFQNIFEDELCAVVPSKAAAGLVAKLTLSELNTIPMLMPTKSSAHRSDAEHGTSDIRAGLASQYESIQVETLLSLAEAGLGAVIVPRVTIPHDPARLCKVLSFKPPMMREICIISLPGKTLSPVAEHLARTATEVLRSGSRTRIRSVHH